jgi:hypothetical protein
MDNSKIPGIIRRRYQKSKELNQDAFDRSEVNKNLYKGIINVDETYEWDYSLVDPQIFPLVRNYLSRSNPSMSAIRLDIRRPEQREARQVNQDFLNWEIGELMTTSLFYRMYFSAYLNGRGYAKTGWKYEKAKEIQEKDEQGNVTRSKILRDVTNRFDAKFVQYKNIIVPDRNQPILKEQAYIIEPMQLLVGDMLDENQYLEDHGEKPYWDQAFLAKLKESGVTGKLLDYEMARATDDDSQEDFAFRSATVAAICMPTKDGQEFYMPLEGEDKIINTDTESRYWHGHYSYIDLCPFPEDDEYHNMALVDVVGDLQIAATEILNQTLTNVRQINNDMWILGSSAAQTPDWQFRKRPDGVIKVMGDVSQVQPVRTQDNTRAAVVMGQELSTKLEKAGGIGSLYSSGVSNSGGINQTARGAQIIDQNIDTNMKMIIDLFGEQVLKPMGEHALELNAQYVTEEQSFSVTGKRGVRDLLSIDPTQVSANFIVTVNPDKIQKQTPASRQASLQNSITVLQGIQTASAGQIQIDFVPITEALIDSTPELDEVGDVVTSLDEQAQRDATSLERGQMPNIKIRDQHEELIVAVNVHYTENEANYPEEIKQLFEDYTNKHMAYIKSKQEMLMMKNPPQVNPAGAGAELPPEAGMGGAPSGAPDMTDPNNQMGTANPTYNLSNIVGAQ